MLYSFSYDLGIQNLPWLIQSIINPSKKSHLIFIILSWDNLNRIRKRNETEFHIMIKISLHSTFKFCMGSAPKRPCQAYTEKERGPQSAQAKMFKNLLEKIL